MRKIAKQRLKRAGARADWTMRVRGVCARALSCEAGIAATELAMVLPVMLVMFFGLVEGSDALTASRRATVAANSLADLAAQAEELDETDVANLFTGVERMLTPSGDDVVFRLISVILDPNDNPVVDWSIDSTGAQPYAEGDPYTRLADTSILEAGASLIVSELHYTHETTFVNKVFDDTIVFDRVSSRWPRIATTTVRFCPTKPCL